MMAWFDEQDAAQLAARLHFDQTDKAGWPYTGHLSRVAKTVKEAHGNADQVIAAWLHDSIEDTGVTSIELLVFGVPASAVRLIEAVTHVPYLSNKEYLDGILTVPDAILIKLADNHDNTDPARFINLDDVTRWRLLRKYGNALIQLAGDDPRNSVDKPDAKV